MGSHNPMAGVVLQLLVMEEVLSSDPTRESRYDLPFSRPGRTAVVLLLYLGHMGNLTGVTCNLLRRPTIKVKLLLRCTNPEGCAVDQGQAF